MVNNRPRVSELGVRIGILDPGPQNSITDVPDVLVGHVSIVEGKGALQIGDGPVRTGVTAILPHRENVFTRKVTGAVHVLNGFGKALGFLQVQELGVIESPVVLTSTLSSWRAADALIDYMSMNNPKIYSFNPVVGECNDGFLNDMVGRHISTEHVLSAIENASSPNTEEGNVGGGTGMTGFDWKGGIGTASRLCVTSQDTFTVGALTMTNTGDPREFRIDGVRVGRHLLPPKSDFDPTNAPGSIIMVIGTEAPVDARQLGRICRRAALGLGRAGGTASHSSGDFIIAFSNSTQRSTLDDVDLTPLFNGTIEATEESVVNSVLRSETMIGRDGNTRYGIPIDQVRNLLS